MTSLPVEIQAARIHLVKIRPYLAAAAWALQPVERAGLGTLAVDQWWRLYYDPAVTTRWSVEELAGVLYHEICHLLRDHASRMRDLNPNVSNICADAEINDDLLREGVKLPDAPVTPASIGQPDGLLAEEYYAALLATRDHPGSESEPQPQPQMHQPAPQQGPSDAGRADGCPNDSAQGTSADNAGGKPPTPPRTAESGGQSDGTQPDDQGSAPDSKVGDSDGSKPGDGGDSMSTPSLGQPSDSSTQSGALSGPPTGLVEDGCAGGQDGGKSGAGAQTTASGGDQCGFPCPGNSSIGQGGAGDADTETQTPAPGAGRCGSCATGHPEPWEDGPPDDRSGISRVDAELIRRNVAMQIQEAIRDRGSVPGHWVRWAEEKLHPKVDWRRELAAAVRHAVADVAGASDYSYRRPSRRQGQIGNGKVILPSLRHPVPSVAVVVDTSGSISDRMLAEALAEIAGILRGLGQRDGIHVLACDAQVQTCRRVYRPEQVELLGGGGTDMCAGLSAAAKLRPTPQVCVVVTDGYTPWPSGPPHGMRVIVVLTGDGHAPEWETKTIRIGGSV